MSTYDLVIRNGILVRAEGIEEAELAVDDGKIVAIAPEFEGTGKEEIDARGLHVLPGGIDAHTHFNEPGRTHWEGFATGSRALAAGGMTAYAEMPINARPPTCDAESFDLKLSAAKASSLIDFAFYGGLVPGNLEHLDELADKGVAGFKAFMTTVGTSDFQAADDLTLYEGMRRAAELGLPVLVHAENKEITDNLANRCTSTLHTRMRDYLDSRPVVAELEAIERAILFAEDTGCSLHVVHVSTGRSVALVAAARARGVDVTCETCPHYLLLTERDAEELGAVAKCAPPLRPPLDLEELWEHIFLDNVEFVTSDHSPCPPEMKASDDFFRVWGGIMGCRSLLNAILDEGYHERSLPLERVVALTSRKVAERFSLPGKGSLEIGADADLALVDLDTSFTLQKQYIPYRHKMSPFVGRTFRGNVVRTILRGRTVFREGKIVSEPIGRLIRIVPQVTKRQLRSAERTNETGERSVNTWTT